MCSSTRASCMCAGPGIDGPRPKFNIGRTLSSNGGYYYIN